MGEEEVDREGLKALPSESLDVIMERKMTRRDIFAFGIVNILVALFYDGIWLLGYRVNSLGDWEDQLGCFQLVIWFFSFLTVAYLFLSEFIKERFVIKCLGIALFFSFLLLLLWAVSVAILAPYLDPWW